MTEPNDNPLTTIVKPARGSLARGTEAALQQLENHCHFLNSIEKRRIHWFVNGKDPHRHVDARDLDRNERA